MQILTTSLFIMILLAWLLRRWLAAHQCASVLPVFFTIVLGVIYVLPLINLEGFFHWYDYPIALAAFVFEWADFLIRDQKNLRNKKSH